MCNILYHFLNDKLNIDQIFDEIPIDQNDLITVTTPRRVLHHFRRLQSWHLGPDIIPFGDSVLVLLSDRYDINFALQIKKIVILTMYATCFSFPEMYYFVFSTILRRTEGWQYISSICLTCWKKPHKDLATMSTYMLGEYAPAAPTSTRRLWQTTTTTFLPNLSAEKNDMIWDFHRILNI